MATVIYDADCGFCKWCLAALLTWDRARGGLRPLPMGTEEADRLLADLSPGERDASWHLIDDAGVRTSAGAALSPMLVLLPGGRLPAAAAARMPRLTERAYRRVADHRGFLGRFVHGRARRWADRVIARSPYP